MTQNEFSVPILTYHSIDSTGSVISTSPEKFRQQMDHLAKSSFQVESLSALALCLRETRPLPKNRVVLTFDDGFKSVYDMAFPVLKEYGFGATVFLVTDYCGKTNGWPGQSARVPPLELMTWDQISSMAPHNIDFGVHTATHPDLSKVSTQKIADEIIGAQVILQQRLGTRQQAFAYPYGRSCSAAADIVKSGFYAACSTRMDVVTTTSDIHFLPRLDMYYFSRNQKFTTLGTPQFERYIRFRSSLRRVREALLRD